MSKNTFANILCITSLGLFAVSGYAASIRAAPEFMALLGTGTIGTIAATSLNTFRKNI